MYYLETKVSGRAARREPVWKPVCYSTDRKLLEDAVTALGGKDYRVTLAAERRSA